MQRCRYFTALLAAPAARPASALQSDAMDAWGQTVGILASRFTL